MAIQPACEFGRRANAGGEERGAALLMTIALAFIISILIAAWGSLTITRSHRVRLDASQLQAFYTAESGIQKARKQLKEDPMWRTGRGTSGELAQLDTLFLGQPDLCAIWCKDRGGFVEVTSIGQSGRAVRGVTTVLGSRLPKEFDCAAIVLSKDTLVLSGGEIRGDLKLSVPPRLFGTLFDGQWRQETAHPRFRLSAFTGTENECLDILQNPYKADLELFSPQIFDEDNPPPLEEGTVVYVNDMVMFEGGERDDPVVFQGPGTIASIGDIQVAEYVRLTGGVRLLAEGVIRLMDGAEIQDGLLYARGGVQLTGSSSFRGQILSPANVLITGQARVYGPSAIFLSKSGATSSGATITVEMDARVQATLFAQKPPSGQAGQVRVKIGHGALVEGLVYCESSSLQLEGTLWGCAVVHSFSSPGSFLGGTQVRTPKNVFAQGKIDRNALSPHFVAPFCFASGMDYATVYWSEIRPWLYPADLETLTTEVEEWEGAPLIF